MNKTQYILLALAFLLITALSFLPKTVVKNIDKELSTKTDTKQENTNSVAQASNDSAVTSMHNTSINEEQLSRLSNFSKSFQTAKDEKTKAIWIDSMIILLQSANKYDSAATIAATFADSYATTSNFLRAGDTYYSALQFSMNEQKSKEFAEKARNYFQKIVDKEPDFSEAKVKLGLTYIVSATPMQGILMIREVLKKEPENTFAIMSLGKLSIQSGQYDKAIERFKQLLEIQKDNVEAKFLLAVSLGETGKKEDALKLLEEIKQTSKDPAVLMQTETYWKQLSEGK
jgi:Flp pilus assembly protein TadD